MYVRTYGREPTCMNTVTKMNEKRAKQLLYIQCMVQTCMNECEGMSTTHGMKMHNRRKLLDILNA